MPELLSYQQMRPSAENLNRPDARQLRAMVPRPKSSQDAYDAAVAAAVRVPVSELKRQLVLYRKDRRSLKRQQIKRPDDPWGKSWLESYKRAIERNDLVVRIVQAELERRKQLRKKTRSFKARG